MEMKWHPIRSVADNPKEYGFYLVTLGGDIFQYPRVHECYYHAGRGEWIWEKFANSPVAWTPLPAPYRPEEGDK